MAESSLQLHNAEHISGFAKDLQRFIQENKLSEQIQDKTYVLVDGWKFAGLNFGISPITQEPVRVGEGVVYIFKEEKRGQRGPYLKTYQTTTDLEIAGAYENDKRTKKMETITLHKYKCNVDLIRFDTGAKIGSGSAICSNEEFAKVGFDEYAVYSMAQTRAIAKAYRNLLGFIMNAAGFETTPAEEMEEKYVKKDKEENSLDNEILDTIDSFTTSDSLNEWAVNEMMDYHSNEIFKKEVNKKIQELRKQEKNGK